MSLPTFLHSVRPYGDIFSVDIDRDDREKNKDVERFVRVTHSRFASRNGTADPCTCASIIYKFFLLDWPYVHPDGDESWHMTGQICIPKRHC
ncbi:hypothetical protein BAE44_0004975 [Dichanthelium oligosanthes]|uniref:Uncharacterized protein n=1 Tax=Dichanthelium oligosanthes TaxID=888268 RepID=A0A1E5W9I9_9POAL|nr:hypothetical protein BAE44_0004975 [Dichanthelium oligosanthes]